VGVLAGSAPPEVCARSSVPSTPKLQQGKGVPARRRALGNGRQQAPKPRSERPQGSRPAHARPTCVPCLRRRDWLQVGCQDHVPECVVVHALRHGALLGLVDCLGRGTRPRLFDVNHGALTVRRPPTHTLRLKSSYAALASSLDALEGLALAVSIFLQLSVVRP
jgi:hypothetical protein